MKNTGKVMVLSTGLLFGSLSTAGALPFAINHLEHVEAASLVSFSKTTYTTTANLKMRTGPSTKNKIVLTIPKGKAVTSSQKNGSWFKVSYTYKSNGKNVSKTGWVSGEYLKKQTSYTKAAVTKTVTFTKTTYTTKENVNMRSGASTSNKIIMTLKKGTKVTANQKNGNWYKVTYTYTSKGKSVTKSGWVNNTYLKEYYQYTKTAGTYYFTKKTSKLYSTPDTKKTAVVSLPAQNGMYSTQKIVNSIGQTWYQVSYNGKTLYVNNSDVSKATSKTFSKKEFQLKQESYLYSSYGVTYTKLSKIPKGALISTTTSIGDWYAITYQGKKGYVAASVLQVAPPTDNNSEGKPIEKPTEKPQTEQIMYLVTGDLNLRKSGEGSQVLAVIPKGTTVTSSGEKNGDWYQVTYKGTVGYVSSTYVKEYALTDYRFIDLRTKSTVTAKQIDDYIAANVKQDQESVLLNKGKAFIDAGNKYGVNALYLAAHAIHESGFGTSNISLGKNNLFGYGSFDKTPFLGSYRFSTVDDCINFIAQKMKSDYLNPNGTHFEGPFLGYLTKDANGTRIPSKSIGMNFWYASDSSWGNKIASHMQKILAFDKQYYEKAAINATVPASPGIPAGRDLFPEGIQVKAKKELLSGVIKSGTVFTMLEKRNDYQVRALVNNKEYWINSISFSKYNEYITALNLGRVINASTLNIRSTPDTSKAAIGSYKLNEYVSLVLDDKGNVIMDSTKTWYNVKFNGKLGWVNKSYIIRELQ